jgi:hypothetical protein
MHAIIMPLHLSPVSSQPSIHSCLLELSKKSSSFVISRARAGASSVDVRLIAKPMRRQFRSFFFWELRRESRILALDRMTDQPGDSLIYRYR